MNRSPDPWNKWTWGRPTPTAHVEPCEEPGPPPPRRYTERGRWFWLYVIVGAALLALTLFMCAQSRFGPAGWDDLYDRPR